jgi:hypothetical protein
MMAVGSMANFRYLDSLSSTRSRRLIGLAAIILWVLSSSLAAQDPGAEAQWDVYRYRMAGKVRLLLFWVGRDDVGGGSIALLKPGPASVSGRKTEAVEVLFGSIPGRVPGKINRWGYGREWASWEPRANPGPRLLSSTFIGFIRHSDEESLSEVRSKSGKTQTEFWYDAIRSEVTESEASSTIHFFSQDRDFDYSQPAAVECAYQQRLRGEAANRSRKLQGPAKKALEAYGFLTAMRLLTDLVADQYKDPKAWTRYRTQIPYFYNGKSYQLALTGLKLHRKFELPVREGRPVVNFTDVAEAGIKTTNLTDGGDHDFSIWFPMKGAMRGIPVKIVDKPRWWLRVELTLDEDSARNGPRLSPHGAMPPCQQAGVTKQ